MDNLMKKEDKKMSKKEEIKPIPIPPMPSKTEMSEEDILKKAEEIRQRKAEEEKKAQEEPKYTLDICETCGTVHGRKIE